MKILTTAFLAVVVLVLALAAALPPPRSVSVSMDTNTVLIGASSNLFKVNSNLVHEVVNAGGIPQGTYVLHGATNDLLPNALKLTPGANITLETNGQDLVIDATGAGSVTHTGGPLSINLPVLGNDGDDVKSVSVDVFKIALDLETGQDIQAWSTHGDDLADGELTGSKVGAGIVGDNITTGTIDPARLDADLQDLADGELTGSKVGAGIAAGNVTTGTVDPARLGGIPQATYVLHGEMNALLPGGLKLTAGANITLTTNGQNLEIAGEAGGGGGSGTVTSVALSVPTNVLAVTGSPVTTSGTIDITFAEQAANKVFAGDSEAGSSEIPTFRSLVLADLPASVLSETDLDSSLDLLTMLGVDKEGSGKAVFNQGPHFEWFSVGNWGSANHSHLGSLWGGYLSADAIASGTFNPARLPLGVTRAGRTIVVDWEYGDDGTGARERSDLPFKSVGAAVAVLQTGDALVIRPGTYAVTRPGMPVNSGQYPYHTTANYLLKDVRDVLIVGHGAVIESTGLGNVWSITDSTNVTMTGLTMRGPGRNPVIAAQICGEVALWGTNYNTRFINVGFEDFPNHGIVVSQEEKTAYNTLVDGCSFIRGGTTNHTTLGVDGAGVASTGPGMRVVGCVFDLVTRGVEIEGSGSLAKGPAVISGNVMTNIINQGVILLATSGSGSALNEISVTGNTITMDQTAHTALGQYGITASGGRRMTISGNVVRRANNTGISLGTAHADLRQCVVANNVVTECGVNIAISDAQGRNIFDNSILHNIALANTSDAGSIIVAGNATKVSGNTVADTQGFGIYVQPPGGGKGSTNVMVTDNLIRTTEFSPIGIAASCYGTVVHANNVTYAGSAVSDSGTGTLINSYLDLKVTGTLTTPGGDVDTRIAGKMSADVTSATITEEPRDWLDQQSYRALHYRRPPTSDQTNYTGTTFALDCDGPKRVEWEITGDASLSLLNSPALGERIGLQFQVNTTNSAITNCVMALDESIRQGTRRSAQVIKAGEFLTTWLDWNGTNWVADWRGDQSEPLPPELGGRGRTNRLEKLVWPTAYVTTGTSNRYDLEMDKGNAREFRINSPTNSYIAASAGRPDTTNDVGTATLRYKNSNTDPSTNSLTLRPDWNLVGMTNHTLYLTSGEFALLTFKPEGPTESEMWVYNELATVTTLTEGGAPPASTLNDGLVAYWKWEATSGSVVDNVLGDANLDLNEHNGAWTKSFAGADGLSWTNTVATRTATNDNAALQLGRSGASFSLSMWVAPQAAGAAFIAGESQASSDFGWHLRTESDNDITFRTSSTGTSFACNSTFQDNPLTINAWNHVIFVFDNDANTARVRVNGVASSAIASAGNIFNAVAGFSLGGITLSAKQGAYDESGVWNRAITTAEEEELWGGGAGKFANGSGVFAP